jgi:hypothetical protein
MISDKDARSCWNEENRVREENQKVRGSRCNPFGSSDDLKPEIGFSKFKG